MNENSRPGLPMPPLQQNTPSRDAVLLLHTSLIADLTQRLQTAEALGQQTQTFVSSIEDVLRKLYQEVHSSVPALDKTISETLERIAALEQRYIREERQSPAPYEHRQVSAPEPRQESRPAQRALTPAEEAFLEPDVMPQKQLGIVERARLRG